MALFNNSNYNELFDQRDESRDVSNNPRPFVRIKAIGDHVVRGGLIIDSSSDGIGLVINNPLPIGTRVAINLADEYTAVGEVVNLMEDFAEWDWSGMSRMGVRFIEKINWPQ